MGHVNLHEFSDSELSKYTRDISWRLSFRDIVNVCLRFLHAFLDKIKRELDVVPEGSILVAKRASQGLEFTFQLISLDDLDGQSEWEVVSKEFKVSNLSVEHATT